MSAAWNTIPTLLLHIANPSAVAGFLAWITNRLFVHFFRPSLSLCLPSISSAHSHSLSRSLDHTGSLPLSPANPHPVTPCVGFYGRDASLIFFVRFKCVDTCLRDRHFSVSQEDRFFDFLNFSSLLEKLV